MADVFLKISLLLPLISFVISLINSNNNNKWNNKIQSLSILICFFLSIFYLMEITDSRPILVTIWTLSSIEGFTMDLSFYLDNVSSTFLFMVTGVFALVSLHFIDKNYSKGYMAVFSLLFLFTQTTVLSSNIIVFICSWCGMGLSTYLLSIFSTRSNKTLHIPEKILMNNAIGDCFLVLGCVGLIPFLGVASFNHLKPMDIPLPPCLFILLGIFIKMGIIPIKSWAGELKNLPSSLFIIIGSGTTLSMGIFLILRLSFIFEGNEDIKAILCLLGLTAAILGALMAIVKRSIKDILVFSTISQLGFMILSCGIGSYNKTILYVLSHSFGKTALLMAGIILSSHNKGRDDIFQIKGKYHSLIFWGLLLAALPFSGIPGMGSLFFQYELAQISYDTKEFSLIVLAMGLNTLCMTRLIGSVFFAEAKSKETKSQIPLMAISTFIGAVIFSSMTGLGILPGLFSWNQWQRFDLSQSFPVKEVIIQENHTMWTFTMISFVIVLCATGFVYIFRKKEDLSFKIKHSCLGIWNFIDQGFMFNRLFNLIFFKEIRLIWNISLLSLEKLIRAPIHILSFLIYHIGVFFNYRESKDMEGDALYIIIGITIIITFVFSSFDI